MGFLYKNNKKLLILRFKLPKLDYIPNETLISSDEFMEKFINNFKNDLNMNFGNCSSINEHANRIKFIEYTKKAIDDVSKLYLILLSFYVYDDVKNIMKISTTFNFYHRNLIEIADYIAGAFQNMKSSFIPSPDFTFAIKDYFDNGYVKNEIFEEKQEEEFISVEEGKEVERLVKIFLFKEDIDQKVVKYFIKLNILEMESKNLKITLKLTGENINNVYWSIVKVDGMDKKTEDIFSKLFDGNFGKLLEFIYFFEDRIKAKETYERLERKTGIYSSSYFSGYFNGYKIIGKFEKRLYLYYILDKKEVEIESLDDIPK